jgi:hypothetical protein
VRDERVVSVVALNPRALVWDPQLPVRREARHAAKVLSLHSWRSLLAGRASWRRVLEIARAAATARPADRGELERCLDRLRDTGTRTLLAFSGEEPLHEELERDGRLTDRPGVRLEIITSIPEHTLRPLALQARTHALLDEALDTA